MDWRQKRRPGAGLYNLGSTCYLNVVLQCLTYTPPLANYLLSRQHSRFCHQQGFCMMCIMEDHVRKVLYSSASAIRPRAVIRDLKFTCLSCKTVSDFYKVFLDILLKIKVVVYPEYLNLRPYMSDPAGEPLLYSLYAVVVHSGHTCLGGHFFCYTKASDGQWYKMNDVSVESCDIQTVLEQQAYLLFYARTLLGGLGKPRTLLGGVPALQEPEGNGGAWITAYTTSQADVLPQEHLKHADSQLQTQLSSLRAQALVRQSGPDSSAWLFRMTFQQEMDQMFQPRLQGGSAARARAVL
ncbi:hypothetical protein DUI87_31597 [Hirundo rustica rustica]|uniref:Ubiquitin carboxyl-terminal hydrolase 36 n=1 Tax=Hirundo rustica rustica TaxID=333673 RepID=A0A3M0IUF7_HIRRU|nr:hypothetical protein DUI87_31597 [Hirundo rustica rustica]